jgi:hypothetical protein
VCERRWWTFDDTEVTASRSFKEEDEEEGGGKPEGKGKGRAKPKKAPEPPADPNVVDLVGSEGDDNDTEAAASRCVVVMLGVGGWCEVGWVCGALGPGGRYGVRG